MSMPTFNYSGRTVFIAGGTSGINLGIAGAFANAGARLAVLGRSPERLDQAQTRLHKFGGEVRGYSADVRDAPAVAVALKAAHDALGAIDVLVSGAAGNFPAPALGMSPNGFKAVIDIDLLGTFNVLRLAHEFLRKPGAATINISAPQGTIAMPLQAHVCAAKAGVDMLTQALALEWGTDGIRVNCDRPRPDRRHRRHGAARADAGSDGESRARGAARQARHDTGRRRSRVISCFPARRLYHRRDHSGRRLLDRQQHRRTANRDAAAAGDVIISSATPAGYAAP